MTAEDAALQRALDELAQPGLLLGHRLITPGDENALLPEEAASIASPIIAVRQASGAARIVARALLARLGHGGVPVPKSASGAPVWPAGITGSLTHDDTVAVAAVAMQRKITAVGIDVEPATPLPRDMLGLVATSREMEAIDTDPLRGKILFAAKEAVYKAVYPIDRIFLEFRDIEINVDVRKATTNSGRTLTLRYAISSHIVAVALAHS